MKNTVSRWGLPPPASLEEFIVSTSGQNRFLVLDCYDGNHFEGALDYFEVKESARFRMPVHTVEGGERDPLLVHLDMEHAETLMQAALEEAVEKSSRTTRESRNISALASSASEPVHVVKSFVRAARYRLRGSTKSAAFRFFDPRVMHTLQRLFIPLQTAMLLGPITYWGYVDFRAQFRLVKNNSPRNSSSVVIRDEQVSVLRRNATVQAALQRLNRFRVDWPEDLDAVLDSFVQHAPEELHKAGIMHCEDSLSAYAALCWLCDTGRADSQLVGQVMKEYRETGAPLRVSLETLLPEFF